MSEKTSIKQVMRNMGLNEYEIQLYLTISHSGPIPVDEMASNIEVSCEECDVIAQKFVRMGLFKKISGTKQYYQALPPFVAIIRQIDNFSDYIANLKEDIPKELLISFQKIEDEAKHITELEAYQGFITEMKVGMSGKINATRNDLGALREESGRMIETQFEALNAQVVHSLSVFDEKFIDISLMLDESMQSFQKEIDNIVKQLDELPAKIAEEKRIFQTKRSLEESVQMIINPAIEIIKNQFKIQFMANYQKLIDTLKESFRDQLNVPLREILEKGRDGFKQDFELPFGELLNNVALKIQATLNEFEEILNEAQEKMGNVKEGINSAFISLRQVFSDRVITTLTSLFSKIKERLDLSSNTIRVILDKEGQCDENNSIAEDPGDISSCLEKLDNGLLDSNLNACADAIMGLKNRIFEKYGHSKQIKEMELWANRLSHLAALDEKTSAALMENIKKWREIANLDP